MGTTGATHTETKTSWDEIGTEGLRGRKIKDSITIEGPCGEGHTMSLNAAAQLRDWLDEKLGGAPTINATAEPRYELVRR